MSLCLESSPLAGKNPLFVVDETRVHDLGTNCDSLTLPPQLLPPKPHAAAPGSAEEPSPAIGVPVYMPSDNETAAAAMVALASAVATISGPLSLSTAAPERPLDTNDEERCNESGSEVSSIYCDGGNSVAVIARSNSYGSTTVLEESPLSSVSVLSAPSVGVSLSPSAQRTQLSPTPEAVDEDDGHSSDSSGGAARPRGSRSAAPGTSHSSSAAILDVVTSTASHYSLNRQVSCQGCSRVFIINGNTFCVFRLVFSCSFLSVFFCPLLSLRSSPQRV
jgi:hypothetical protein